MALETKFAFISTQDIEGKPREWHRFFDSREETEGFKSNLKAEESFKEIREFQVDRDARWD